MATKNFRKRVMKYAHQMIKNNNVATWRECLKQAWRCYKLTQRMRSGVAHFCYMKTDGSIRRAVGTLCNLPLEFSGKKHGKPSYKTICYYDLEKQGFRCFRTLNLISWQYWK